MNWAQRHWDVLKESVKQSSEADKIRRANDNTAFLPAALEVLETPPNPLGRIVLWVTIAFVALALAWACIGEVDEVATAQGRIIPDGRIKTMQAADQGVVRAIYVHEGQRVAQGEPLIELDATEANAQVVQADQAALVAAVDRARAQALLDYANGQHKPLNLPDGVDEATRSTQQAIVAARIAEHNASRADAANELAQRHGDRAMVEGDVSRIEQQLPLEEQQLQAYQSLQARGFAPRLRVAQVEEQTIGMRHDLIIRRAEAQRARAAEGSAADKLSGIDATFRREALDAFNEADATFKQRQQEATIAHERQGRTVMRAPATGVVQQLQVHTVGAVVRPADQLLTVVPDGSTLVVEAMVLNRDVGFVHEGQQVRVKLEAFPFTRYGVVDGRLTFLSRDAIQDEHQGLIFPARIELSRFTINVDGRRMNLSAGLATTAEIRTGRRRIIEFLLSPLARRVEEAGRER